jgi:choice-of-anchor B domain-containing protein
MVRLGIFFLFFCLRQISVHGQHNLQLIGHLDYDSLTLAGCWHHIDSEGNEYALVGTSSGLSIVNLNEPSAPYEMFSVPSLINNWREVKTWAGYAYVSTEAAMSGITIVNLNHLPDSISYRVWTGDDTHPDLVLSAHALAATDGYLYIFGSKPQYNGAIICNLDDPWNPQVTGVYSNNYVHDGYIRNDTLWAAEILAGQCAIIDVADKTQPILLATQPTPAAFNHNTWLSDNSKILYTTDERPNAPLAAYDISDLDNITLLDTYFPSQQPDKEVHNVRILNDYLINPSYGGQLTIVDGHKPDNLVEIAFASTGSSLVWDADPYLPSGVVFATAKNEGLFIYQPNYVRASYLEGTVTDSITQASIHKALVRIVSTSVSDSTNVEGQYKTGYYNPGFYNIEVSAAGYFSRTIQMVELKSGQVTNLSVQLSPDLSLSANTAEEPKLKVYPTTFNTAFTIDGRSLKSGRHSYDLSDMQGRLIYSADLPAEKVEINLGGILKPGQYLLTVRNTRGIIAVERLIKG